MRIKVPAKTPSGKTFVLKGRGMPVLEGKGRGDLRVKIQVGVPARPTKKEREMLEELARHAKKDKFSPDAVPFAGARS